MAENRLRVALFSGNYNYERDGANKALNRLVGYLESQGVPVIILSPTGETPAFAHEGTVISVPSVSIPGRGEYRLGLPLGGKLKADLDAFGPTLVHLSAPDWLGHSALRFAEQKHLPAIASFHTRFDTYLQHYGLGWLEAACRRLMQGFYARCEQVFVPSPCMERTLRADGILSGDVRIWSRGINRQTFAPHHRDMAWRRTIGVHDDEVLVTFVGRLVREKGLHVFADTMDVLKARGVNAKALIVGEGPDRDLIAGRLPDAVMTGYLSGAALSRAYASTDIFLNPSLTETFGNVTLEAMASGVVPVCVNATGSASLVRNGENGLLVDEVSAEDIADAVARVAGDTVLRKRLAMAAFHSSARYDWDEVLGEVLTGYYQALGLAPSHRPQLAA